MAFRSRNRFKFTEKKQSIKGIVALSLAAVLLILYALFFYMAYKSQGTLSIYFGSFGVLAVVVTVVNLVLSIQSMREENSFQLIPHIAFIVTVLEGICWIGTYVIGLR